MLSSTTNVSVFIVVVVPDTVKLPPTVTFPEVSTVANVTLSVVATAYPIDISPEDIATPVPAVKCALTSEADGPV